MGTVTYDEEAGYKKGDTVTFYITPEQNWYVSGISFDGKEEINFDPDGGKFTATITDYSTLYVSFSNIENTEKIPVFSTPWLFFHDKNIYYFGKVYSGLKPEETGVLISKELNEPIDGVGDTVRVKTKIQSSRKGYFAFELINSTGNYSQTVYIRPYAVYNGKMQVGITEKIDFSGNSDINGLTKKDTWFAKNHLNDTDVSEYTY